MHIILFRTFKACAVLSLLTAASVGGGLAIAQAATDPAPMATLDMFDQSLFERDVLRIMAMPQMQQQIRESEGAYRQSARAKTADGAARLKNALTGMAMAAAENAVLEDAARPRIAWIITQPHNWYGVQWPGSMWGGHNPDNFSRRVVIDQSSTYEITGKRVRSGPGQESFNMHSGFAGTGVQSLEGSPIVSTLLDRDMTFEPDGSFTITVGPGAARPGPARPGLNYLHTPPDGQSIEIRDTLNDWRTQVPNRLRIRRIAGPPAPPARSDEQIAQRAAELLKITVPYWIKFDEERTFSQPPNTIRPAQGRQGGWGYITGGRFEIGDDEALVVTVDPIGAAYLGFQIMDVWSTPPDYINHNAGLNRGQLKPNQDGTFTYVVAARDPGVFNWVDTVGMHSGGIAIRWQALADRTVSPVGAVRAVQVAKIEQLRKVLPSETVWVTKAERLQQIADRVATFARRLHN